MKVITLLLPQVVITVTVKTTSVIQMNLKQIKPILFSLAQLQRKRQISTEVYHSYRIFTNMFKIRQVWFKIRRILMRTNLIANFKSNNKTNMEVMVNSNNSNHKLVSQTISWPNFVSHTFSMVHVLKVIDVMTYTSVTISKQPSLITKNA